jgi:hypothetical protein
VLNIREQGEVCGRSADVQLPGVTSLELDRDRAVGFDLGCHVDHGVMLPTDAAPSKTQRACAQRAERAAQIRGGRASAGRAFRGRGKALAPARGAACGAALILSTDYFGNAAWSRAGDRAR